MGLEARNAVMARSKATGSARTVQLALADYAADGEEWLVYVTNRRLEEEWGILERTIQRALRELEKLGELRRRPDRETTSRKRVYELVPGGSLQLALPLSSSDPKPVTPSDTRLSPRQLARARHEGTEVTGERIPPPVFRPSDRGKGTRRRQPPATEDYVRAAVAAAECCPEPSDSLSQAEQAWETVKDKVLEAVGDLTWQIWFQHVHAHELRDGLLVVAVGPSEAVWMKGRYDLLFRRLDPIVSVVGCKALSPEAVAS